jgi:flagellar hook protein FlgE
VLPFTFTATPATGEGATTAFQVYDSLGNLVNARLRVALESRDETGTVWRFYAESLDDTSSGVLGTGTISFDQNGQFVSATGTDLSIDLADSGSVTPLTFSLDFSALTGLADAEGESVLVLASQNGRPAGTLIEYEIGSDGIITGIFSNDATQVYGQLALATFTNPEGLIGLNHNSFMVGVNSGAPVVLAPQSENAGRIQAGSLELSNVDLSREFVGLITASTGFSAAGRVVRTADELLQELLLLVR